MPFFGKYRRLKVTLIATLGTVLSFDLAMAAWALLELRSCDPEKNTWLVSDQELAPSGPPRGRSVILVHGFLGSPLDVEPLAEPLRREGFRVVAPLVPGQSRCASAYTRGSVTVEDYRTWLRGIVRAEAGRTGRAPHVVGFSMGGTLAVEVAAGGGVDRLVLIAPWFALPAADRLLETLARAFRFIVPVVPKPWTGRIDDPEGRSRYEPGSRLVSLRAFLRLHELADLAASRAGEIASPTLVILAAGDAVASPDAIRAVFRDHPRARIVELPRSNHVVLYDHDRDTAIREVLDFLAR